MLVVQVDGKVRDRIEVGADADEASLPRARPGFRSARPLDGDRAIRTVVVRPPRLANVVTER